MRRFAFLALTVWACAPQQSASKFKGVDLGTCPPRIEGAALFSIGEDVSADLAEQKARAAFEEEHAIPDALKPIALVRSLAGCREDDGSFFVAVGLKNADLNKLRDAAAQAPEPLSVQTAIAQSAKTRRWNQLCGFLRDHKAQCQSLDEVPAKQRVTQLGGTITVQTVSEAPAAIEEAIVQSILATGIRVLEGGSASLTAVIGSEAELLPITDEQKRFVRARVTVKIIATGNNLLAERTWEAKGGGLNEQQATSNAHRDLASKLKNEMVISLFGGDAP